MKHVHSSHQSGCSHSINFISIFVAQNVSNEDRERNRDEIAWMEAEYQRELIELRPLLNTLILILLRSAFFEIQKIISFSILDKLSEDASVGC